MSLFKSRLSNFIQSSKTQRDNLDWLIHAGIVQYAYTGQTGYLNSLLNQSVSVKSLPTVTIKDFIKEHTDLKLKTDSKTNVMTFIRANKEGEKVAILPPFKWYDWKKAKHNDVKEVDHSKLAIKHLKALNDGNHSFQYLANVLIESGFSTDQLLKMVDSVSLKAA